LEFYKGKGDMKKTIIFTLAIAVAVLFAGCGSEGGSSKKLNWNYVDSKVQDSMLEEVSFSFEANDKDDLQVYMQIYKGYEQLHELKTPITDKDESILYLKVDYDEEITWTLEGTDYTADLSSIDFISDMGSVKTYISTISNVSSGRAMIMVMNINEDEMPGETLNFVEDSNFEGILNTNVNEYTVVLSVGLAIDIAD
jgi:hypothetical protein